MFSEQWESCESLILPFPERIEDPIWFPIPPYITLDSNENGPLIPHPAAAQGSQSHPKSCVMRGAHDGCPFGTKSLEPGGAQEGIAAGFYGGIIKSIEPNFPAWAGAPRGQ